MISNAMKNNLEKRIEDDNYWVSEYLEAIEIIDFISPSVENDFWKESIKREKFASLVEEYPAKVQHWIRFSRVFNNKIWSRIRPACEKNFGQFVKDCETIRTYMKPINEKKDEIKRRLEKISAEKLVIHFAYWLEKKYFEEDDDCEFSKSLVNYFNVLQECLTQGKNKRVRDQRSVLETNKEELWEVYKTGQLNEYITQFFDGMEEWIRADFLEEMFCSQGWPVSYQNGVGVLTPTDKQQSEIKMPIMKAFANEIIELELPFTEEDIDHRAKMLNPETLHSDWHQYTGLRFLRRCFGDDLLSQVNEQAGFEIQNILRVLLVLVGHYKKYFKHPRYIAKQEGKGFLSSLIPLSSFNSEIEYSLLCHPMHPREFSCLTGFVKELMDDTISIEETQRIFAAFTADIHDDEATRIKFANNLLLLKNESCYLFLPRLFFDDKYVIQIIFNLIFSINEDAAVKHMEKQIQHFFEYHQFHAITRYPLDFAGENRGEVDVLAFRDNTLFIIEAKTTYQRILVNHIRSLRVTYYEAGEQLNNILDLLPEYWADISSKLNISVPYASVKKVTLIVTNSCEYDHQYFNGHLKISLSELENVLDAPNPFMLFLLQKEVQSLGSQCDPELPPDNLNPYRLFPSDNPSVDQIIACLEESRFWKLVLDEQIEPTPLFSVPPVDSPKEI